MGKAGEEGGEMEKAQPFVPVEHTKLASGRQSMAEVRAWRQGKNQKWREKKARQWTNHRELERSNPGEKRHRGRWARGIQHSQDGAQTQQSSSTVTVRALHSHLFGQFSWNRGCFKREGMCWQNLGSATMNGSGKTETQQTLKMQGKLFSYLEEDRNRPS